MVAPEIRRVTGQLSKTGRFCNTRPSPATDRLAGVQNPCPKSTSHNQPCHTVLRRSPAWDTCSAMPASPPPTSTPSSRSTPSSTPAAIGCSPKPPAAPRTDRPTLAQVLDQLRPGDTVVVWNLDRLGRSLRHLVDTVTGLAERAIGFCSLREAIDTTTPGGKLVFHVVAALAEFERDLIRERTSAGLAAARARGRHGGRPRY
jgi:hypothetical protein